MERRIGEQRKRSRSKLLSPLLVLFFSFIFNPSRFIESSRSNSSRYKLEVNELYGDKLIRLLDVEIAIIDCIFRLIMDMR